MYIDNQLQWITGYCEAYNWQNIETKIKWTGLDKQAGNLGL